MIKNNNTKKHKSSDTNKNTVVITNVKSKNTTKITIKKNNIENNQIKNETNN